jgi:hypothetical protein
MLKNILLIILISALIGCTKDLGEVKYCSENTDYKFYFDFDNLVIRFIDPSGESQVVSKIEPCAPQVRDCFKGYVNFINPLKSEALANTNHPKFSLKRNGKYTFVDITNGSSRTYYGISKEDAFPESMSISFLNGPANGKYNLCNSM